MKKISYFTAITLAIFSVTTYAASPSTVQKINSEQAVNLQRIGAVSISGVRGGPSSAVLALKDKAANAGASHIRIVGIDNPGDSSHWRGSAIIYR